MLFPDFRNLVIGKTTHFFDGYVQFHDSKMPRYDKIRFHSLSLMMRFWDFTSAATWTEQTNAPPAEASLSSRGKWCLIYHQSLLTRLPHRSSRDDDGPLPKQTCWRQSRHIALGILEILGTFQISQIPLSSPIQIHDAMWRCLHLIWIIEHCLVLLIIYMLKFS